jgi:hypothetical protein
MMQPDYVYTGTMTVGLGSRWHMCHRIDALPKDGYEVTIYLLSRPSHFKNQWGCEALRKNFREKDQPLQLVRHMEIVATTLKAP